MLLRVLLLVGLVFSLATTGCAQLLIGGLTAAQALQPISDEQEVAIGNAAVQQLAADPNFRLYSGQALNQYVARVGLDLARDTSRANLPWRFGVVVSDDLNAFALPGGVICVTTGALKAMKNEAELAAVLAHEIAHVVERHGIDQMKRAMVAQGLAIAALGTSPQIAQAAGSIALQIVLNGYGRDAEFEADRVGAQLAAANRYDPEALVGFLQTIAARGGETPGWLVPLSNHPTVQQRVQAIEAIVREKKLTGSVTNASQFKRETAPL
jgi:predicted Zn-dependent protease